jgi:hypothetical protein
MSRTREHWIVRIICGLRTIRRKCRSMEEARRAEQAIRARCEPDQISVYRRELAWPFRNHPRNPMRWWQPHIPFGATQCSGTSSGT